MPFDNPNITLYLALTAFVSVFAGALASAWISRANYKKSLEQQQQQQGETMQVLQLQIKQLHQSHADLVEENQAAKDQQMASQLQLGQLQQAVEQIPSLEKDKAYWLQQHQMAQHQITELKAEIEAKKAAFEQERLAAQDKLAALVEAETRLKNEFENLANKIFEQKNEKYTQTSKASLDALLTPLKDQIEGFKRQISDQYVKEGQERTALKTEILGLKQLNQQITQEAAALTKALKGDNKQQGNWGEVVLERILKESGLREGHEFRTQTSLENEQGKKFQPDVLVHLPNEKDVVIDSKVSLNAYNQYFHAQQEAEKQRYLNEHVASLKEHIKGLGSKDYQNLRGLRTLDYVLMFVPVEPAFLLAIECAPELVQLALDNNIMLVSPTNLLVALRTIHNIWQVEQQNQNAVEIAQKAGALYDKFVAFTEDMKGVGTSLQTVQKKYQGAVNKLTEGRGNLVRRSEELKQLGVQASKKLDNQLVDKADLD